MSAAGRPATDEHWTVVVGWVQGGEQGWTRSMAIPRRCSPAWGGLVPVGVAVAAMRTAALPHILAGDAAATGKRENQGPGPPGCNSFNTAKVGLYAKIFYFFGFLD